MIVPLRILKAVATHCAKEPIRYAITGVLLERAADGYCRAVATDGRRLMAVRWSDTFLRADREGRPLPEVADPPAWSAVIPTVMIAATLRTAGRRIFADIDERPAKDNRPVLVVPLYSPVYKHRAQLPDVEMTIAYDTRAMFPQWRHILPQIDSTTERGDVCLSSWAFASATAALDLLFDTIDEVSDHKYAPAVAVSCIGATKPITLTCKGSVYGIPTEALVVIMPVARDPATVVESVTTTMHKCRKDGAA